MPRDSTSTHALRVLVVEDEALIALETTGHLQDWGYRVAGVAGTFREALAAARDAEIDVALVDVNLRHGDRSEEHTSELQSLMRISYAVFCLKKKKNKITDNKNAEDTKLTKNK